MLLVTPHLLVPGQSQFLKVFPPYYQRQTLTEERIFLPSLLCFISFFTLLVTFSIMTLNSTSCVATLGFPFSICRLLVASALLTSSFDSPCGFRDLIFNSAPKANYKP
ncbi:unnamed protein product [Lepidochelys olivacea]